MESWTLIAVVAVVGLIGAVVAFRIRFDLNVWLRDRRDEKILKEFNKRADRCAHAWTLYPNDTYSQCVGCEAWIQTNMLLAARRVGDVKPLILGERPGVVVKHDGPFVLVNNYIGKVGPGA